MDDRIGVGDDFPSSEFMEITDLVETPGVIIWLALKSSSSAFPVTDSSGVYPAVNEEIDPSLSDFRRIGLNDSIDSKS